MRIKIASEMKQINREDHANIFLKTCQAGKFVQPINQKRINMET